MSTYICKVVTEQGNIVERTIKADSVTEVTDILSKKKEQLVSAKKQGLSLNIDGFFEQYKKVPPEQMKMFTNQLRTMMDSGVPLLAALDVLERQAAMPKLRNIVNDLHKRVSSGDPLSEAMSHHPDVFNTLYVAMIRAGESAGVMGEVLDQLEMFNEIDIKTKKSIKKATRYPMMVMGVMVLASGFAVVKIVPTFATMLTGMGAELPLLTRMLLAASDFAQNYGLFVVLGIVAIIVGFKQFKKTPAGTLAVDKLKLNLPVAKTLLRTAIISRFTLVLKTLITSGTQIVDALEIAKNTIDNKVYEQVISDGRDKIIQGQPIHVALENEYIPSVALNMIAIGEETGSLDKMLGSVADFYLVELEDKLDGLTAAIEPLVTIFIGVFVAGFVASIFLPMFKMYEVAM